MYLPNEMIIYILSYLDKRYNNYVYSNNHKCLCHTVNSGFTKKCKKPVKIVFCSIHMNVSLEQKLSSIQSRYIRYRKYKNERIEFYHTNE